MGIKFLCPNGHKLNVKNFLSGKRAICPKCGARVVVPGENLTAQDGPGLVISGSQSDSDVVLASSTASGSRAGDAAAAGDAIAEAPSAVWYVRPATGGQYGPASGDIMRAWVNEGRVGASSLVWRNGWPEWRSAAAVFPQLGTAGDASQSGLAALFSSPDSLASGAGRGNVAPSGSSLPRGSLVQNISAGQGDASLSGLSTGVPPLVQTVRKRRRKNDRRLIYSAALVVVAIILGILLVVVFRRQSRPVESPTQEESPPVESPMK